MLKDYGIESISLTKDDLELVRKWRSSDKIKKYARNQDYITKEQQKNCINPQTN